MPYNLFDHLILARNFFVAIVDVMKEEKLLHLLRKKKGFFETILELSQEEAVLPLSEWISALEQKKILLSCIEEIDAELMPWKQSMHNLSQEISEELESIRTVIKEILHLDVINLEKRKKELRPPVHEQ
jgi:hypothetical protein